MVGPPFISHLEWDTRRLQGCWLRTVLLWIWPTRYVHSCLWIINTTFNCWNLIWFLWMLLWCFDIGWCDPPSYRISWGTNGDWKDVNWERCYCGYGQCGMHINIYELYKASDNCNLMWFLWMLIRCVNVEWLDPPSHRISLWTHGDCKDADWERCYCGYGQRGMYINIYESYIASNNYNLMWFLCMLIWCVNIGWLYPPSLRIFRRSHGDSKDVNWERC